MCDKIKLYEKLKPSNAVSVKCESCKRTTSVTYFCVECNYVICKVYQEQHLLLPALRSHAIEAIGNFQSDQRRMEKLRVSSEAPVWELHVPEELRFYCKSWFAGNA